VSSAGEIASSVMAGRPGYGVTSHSFVPVAGSYAKTVPSAGGGVTPRPLHCDVLA
jgi:hypothetical protein